MSPTKSNAIEQTVQDAASTSASSTDITDLLDNIRHQADELGAQKATVQAEIAALEAKREDLLDAPLTRADLREHIGCYVDGIAAAYPELSGLKGAMSRLCRPSGYMNNLCDARGNPRVVSMRTHDQIMADPIRSNNMFGMTVSDFRLVMDNNGIMARSDVGFFFFFGDIIKAKLIDYFDREIASNIGQEDHAGPPMTERRQMIADIESDIEKLQSRLVRISDQLDLLRSASVQQQGTSKSARLPKIKRSTSFIPRPAQDASMYTHAEVISLTGFNDVHLHYAIAHEGFPAATTREHLRFWPAARVDAWIMRHSDLD